CQGWVWLCENADFKRQMFVPSRAKVTSWRPLMHRRRNLANSVLPALLSRLETCKALQRVRQLPEALRTRSVRGDDAKNWPGPDLGCALVCSATMKSSRFIAGSSMVEKLEIWRTR